ncbi:MAG: ribosome maturation factor RimM [Lachnospiraceae bacterium]|nr:ribosome maturation factor RimM [Lachnospiraceae bacterium]MDE6233763.1 ribosome maturation factor RimM [Lachnospiraceae bacterium]MDE6254318.1 ribosome maturation factor RimM [Lachnospiraceae bacterium]
MDKENMLQVGVITATHGIKGEVKVFPTTDDINRFDYLKKVFIDSKEGLIQVKVSGVRYFKNLVIVKFKGINDINDVEKYKKCPLLVTREDAVPLEEGEYYITDIIGINVVTDDGVLLGTIKDVLQTGANDVYIIQTEDKKEILIPAIKQCILNVDLDKKEMKIHLLEGLI